MLRTLGIVWLIASSAIAQSELSSQGPGATGRVNAAPVCVIVVDDLHLDFTSTGHIQELLRTIAGCRKTKIWLASSQRAPHQSRLISRRTGRGSAQS